MSCCWSYWPWPTLRRSQVQNHRQGDGNDDKGETHEGNCDLETGPLWHGYVWITPAAPYRLVGKGITASPSSDPTALFCFDDVWGHVHITQRVTIPPFGTISMHGNTGIWRHCMWVHVLAEPVWGPQLPTSMIPTAKYGELHLGSSLVPICLRILSVHSIEIPAKAIVGKVTPANQVLLMVLLMETQGGPPAVPRKDVSWRNWTSRA